LYSGLVVIIFGFRDGGYNICIQGWWLYYLYSGLVAIIFAFRDCGYNICIQGW